MKESEKMVVDGKSRSFEDVGESVRTAIGDVVGKIGPMTSKNLAALLDSYQDSIVERVVDAVSTKMDAMTGQAILENLDKYVKTQAIYNDVLATKLQEALDRIEVLEAKAGR